MSQTTAVPARETMSERAERVFEHWDKNYKYPLQWEWRVNALKDLIRQELEAVAKLASPSAEPPKEPR